MAYTFRKLKLADAYKFRHWGTHEDVRFFQYNFPFVDEADYIYWYLTKQRLLIRKIYGLFDTEDQPVGFITLKHIRWTRRSAELGIAIDPDHLSVGLGQNLIDAFLNHIFTHYPIHKLQLRVAEFNTRAQRCYAACGFKTITKQAQPFEEQSFKEEIMAQYGDQFFISDNVLYTNFFVMEIDRKNYFKNRHQAS